MNQGVKTKYYDFLKLLLNKVGSVLIPLKKDFSSDELGSALAIKSYLKKEKKNVAIICPKEKPKDKLMRRYPFLKLDLEHKNFYTKVPSLYKKKIRFDLKNLYWHRCIKSFAKDKLELVFTTKKKRPDVLFQRVKEDTVKAKWDLVLCLGGESLSDFDVFKGFDNYKYIYNLDFNLNNKRFGNYNLIEPNSVSISHIIYNWLCYVQKPIDSLSATRLLAGVIEQTNGLYTPFIKASVYDLVAKLLKLGADRDAIFNNLYKTKTKKELDVLAKALGRIKELDSIFGVKSTGIILHKDDFGTDLKISKVCLFVLKELTRHFDLGEIVLVIGQLSEEVYIGCFFQKGFIKKLKRFKIKKDLYADLKEAILKNI